MKCEFLSNAHDAMFSPSRAGDAAGVVVGHRLHPIHWPGYGGQVWKRACHHHPQPQLWDWLPLWLDHVWKIRCLRGQLITLIRLKNMLKLTSVYLWVNDCQLHISLLMTWLELNIDCKKPKLHYKTIHLLSPPLEFKGASQTWATESSSDWLDLVLLGDSLLQKKVGGGPKYCLWRTWQAQRLSWIYVGRYTTEILCLSVFWHVCVSV